MLAPAANTHEDFQIPEILGRCGFCWLSGLRCPAFPNLDYPSVLRLGDLGLESGPETEDLVCLFPAEKGLSDFPLLLQCRPFTSFNDIQRSE